MLATFMLIAAAGPWSYSGMLANPGPPPAPKPPAPPAPAIVRPAEAPAPPAVAVKQASPPPTPPAPTIWRLADANGQVWEHTDPAWLRSYVSGRNRQILAPLPPAPTYCGPSGCPR